jgi:hypothetical protein
MMNLLIASAAEKSALKWFLGALHPGIVHFPIGSWRRRRSSS